MGGDCSTKVQDAGAPGGSLRSGGRASVGGPVCCVGGHVFFTKLQQFCNSARQPRKYAASSPVNDRGPLWTLKEVLTFPA